MARRKITATMLDGTTLEATGKFMSLADRVAFERKFGVSTALLTKHVKLFDEGGNVKEGADLSEFIEDNREEYHAFLSWRILARDGFGGEFEDFVENCASIVVGPREDGGVDPTTESPQPGS